MGMYQGVHLIYGARLNANDALEALVSAGHFTGEDDDDVCDWLNGEPHCCDGNTGVRIAVQTNEYTDAEHCYIYHRGLDGPSEDSKGGLIGIVGVMDLPEEKRRAADQEMRDELTRLGLSVGAFGAMALCTFG